jgi:O-succinylbenzoic acid--CoA ligase
MMVIRSIIGNLKLTIGTVNSDPILKADTNIDFIAMVPLQLYNSLRTNESKLRKIKTILIGGGSISTELSSSISASKLNVYHSFGMTETISHVAIRKINNEENEIYVALPGINFSIANNNQLVIHYPEIGLKDLHTNDIVDLIDDRSFRWQGRADFVINSGGKKLSPEKIEKDLATLISVPFFVFGLPDKILGEKVALFIESKFSLNISRDALKNVLEKHALPKEIFYIPNFIRTHSDKINRIETVKLVDQHVLKALL